MSVTQRQLNYTSVTLTAGGGRGRGGGQLATGLLCLCVPQGTSGDCGTVVCLCRGPKSFSWHSLAEEQKAQMLDL